MELKRVSGWCNDPSPRPSPHRGEGENRIEMLVNGVEESEWVV
jgi:hypothetical protein